MTTATGLSVEAASARILDTVRPLPPERVGLLDALGRVLAEPLVSPVTLPAWANSAMDGYAVRAADVAGASPGSPVRLPVVETIAAGGFPSRALRVGEAMQIMTGAPLPDGADSVVRVEDTSGGTRSVEIRDARDAGRNVRPRGEDMRAGDTVLAAGTALGPGQLGVLAACGAATVGVHRLPRVAIAGSGDELVELDRFAEALAGRKVVSTNGYALHAAVREAGGVPTNLGVASDSPESLRELLARAAGCDLIVTSAGNSVGAYDHTRDVVASLGGALDFWRVRMRPGAPLGFGRVGTTPWLGLPGNPVSALVTFELFARPVIRRMAGHSRLFRRPVRVTLAEPVAATAARVTHFLRAIVDARPDGELVARLTGPQGSGIVTSVARANALVVLPEGCAARAAGETATALLITDDAALGSQFVL